MRRQSQLHKLKDRNSQAGMSLIETMIALAILLVVAAGVMSVAAIALSTTETQGHLTARSAEYAQDKMEQLLALRFCDGPAPNGTNTTVFPAVADGRNSATGLAGCNNPGNTPTTPTNPLTALAGGNLSTTAPAAGYVDYLDSNGSPVGAQANWQYIRVWQISVPAGSTGLKQITVKAQVKAAVGNIGLLPQTTVVALKTWPF